MTTGPKKKTGSFQKFKAWLDQAVNGMVEDMQQPPPKKETQDKFLRSENKNENKNQHTKRRFPCHHVSRAFFSRNGVYCPISGNSATHSTYNLTTLLIMPNIRIFLSLLHWSYYNKGLVVIELYWSIILQHPLLTIQYEVKTKTWIEKLFLSNFTPPQFKIKQALHQVVASPSLGSHSHISKFLNQCNFLNSPISKLQNQCNSPSSQMPKSAQILNYQITWTLILSNTSDSAVLKIQLLRIKIHDLLLSPSFVAFCILGFISFLTFFIDNWSISSLM